MEKHDLIRLDLPGDPKYLSVLGACIQEMLSQVEIQDREMAVYSIQLAAHEGCTNVIDHAYGGAQGRIAIALSILSQPARFICEIQDTGTHTFDPAAVAEPAEDNERGRGLALIRQLVDKVVYHSYKGQTWQSTSGGPWEPMDEGNRDCLPSTGNYWRMIKNL